LKPPGYGSIRSGWSSKDRVRRIDRAFRFGNGLAPNPGLVSLKA
jgi:hypothetical protein